MAGYRDNRRRVDGAHLSAVLQRGGSGGGTAVGGGWMCDACGEKKGRKCQVGRERSKKINQLEWQSPLVR